MKTELRLLFTIIILGSIAVNAQNSSLIFGKVYDADFSESMPSATIVLLNPRDSMLVSGAISDANGEFRISAVSDGNYLLTVGFVGFKTVTKNIELLPEGLNVGTIYLSPQLFEIGEALVVAERRRAGSNGSVTSYHINNRMEKVAATGADLLNFIPGVQIDLMQNLTIQGRQNIKVLVNNIERELPYLRQLDASRIERVEVNLSPGAGYEAEINGVINIILKERETGWNGHIHFEAPITQSEYYLFPNYGVNVGVGKFNFFTSYDGELSGFDIEERSRHTALLDGVFRDFTSVQEVVQDYRSHRFHYGFDFYLNKRNLFNFYAYTNPYSNEHDGNVSMVLKENEEIVYDHVGTKNDYDRNYRSFYSLYFQHIFSENQQVSADATFYRFIADNHTWYEMEKMEDFSSLVSPFQQNISLKIDHRVSLDDNITMASGFRKMHVTMEDRLNSDFKYDENLTGIYTEISGRYDQIGFGAGFRVEKRKTELADVEKSNKTDLFPTFRMNVNPGVGQQIEMRYSRSVNRPHIYQMNPYLNRVDPMFLSSGNSALEPSFTDNVQLEYSLGFGSGFISSQLFYNQHSDFIGGYTEINDLGNLEREYNNLGKVNQYGFQVVSALNLWRRLSISPYFKYYRNSSDPFQEQKRVNASAFETAFSAAMELGKTTSASVMFQYNSPVTTFQNRSGHDALYFVTIDQKFGSNWTAGLKSALPFAGSFVYQANEINGENFKSDSTGTISFSKAPLWFYLRWQFNSGRNVNRIGRDKEDFNNLPSKGF